MHILRKSLSADDWHFIDEVLLERHQDRAMSYEVVPGGLLVRMWTVDNVNDPTYGPFSIRPEYRIKVEHYVDKLNKEPCPLGKSCPSEGIPEESLAPEDWNALNRAVHQNYETSYVIVKDGIAVLQHASDGAEKEIVCGPLPIKTEYRQVVRGFVDARNAKQ